MFSLSGYTSFVLDYTAKKEISLNGFVRSTFPWSLSCEVDAEGRSRQKAISFYSLKFDVIKTRHDLIDASVGLTLTLFFISSLFLFTLCCGDPCGCPCRCPCGSDCTIGFIAFTVSITSLVCDLVFIFEGGQMLQTL